MAASFLLGNLPDAAQARLGLIAVLGGAAIIVSNDPNNAAGDFLFIPGLYVDPMDRRLRPARTGRGGRGCGGARAARRA